MRRPVDPEALASAVLDGEAAAVARAITAVENDLPDGRAVLDRIFPHTGKAHIVGMTGAFQGEDGERRSLALPTA